MKAPRSPLTEPARVNVVAICAYLFLAALGAGLCLWALYLLIATALGG